MALHGFRVWLAAAAVALVIGTLEALQAYIGMRAFGRPVPFVLALTSTLPVWVVFAGITPAIVWLAQRYPLDRRWRRHVGVHVLASGASSVVVLGAGSWVSDYVLRPEPMPVGYLANLARLLGLYFVLQSAYYWAILGAWHAWWSQRRLRERERSTAELELRASQLQASLVTANLKALRMQLNPHFLFNTLNSVAVLALKGETEKVADVVSRLGELLRVVLENSGQLTSLAEEVAFLRGYLEIEGVRFGARLQTRVEVAPDALEARVPSLLLQPLVENAVIHGISRTRGPGRIEVEVARDGDHVRVEVRDTGPGFPGGGGGQVPGGGMGLGNTAARLQQLYGEDHQLWVGNAPGGGGLVRLRIPVQPAELPRLQPLLADA